MQPAAAAPRQRQRLHFRPLKAFLDSAPRRAAAAEGVAAVAVATAAVVAVAAVVAAAVVAVALVPTPAHF